MAETAAAMRINSTDGNSKNFAISNGRQIHPANSKYRRISCTTS
jgi:hypothetical protein